MYDLCIVLDAGDKERIGDFSNYFDSAAATACIDHHITNSGFAQMMHVCPDRSATSEVLFTLMDDAFVDKNVAECLYMGIVHDTGVFKHSNTTGETMRIAGELIDKGMATPPALIIGVPVGFVNVTESKELIMELENVPWIVARGRKGGINVAAAIVNALLYVATDNVRE